LTVPDVPVEAVPIRRASSVMLVRDAASGLEVFTLRRVAEMAFAAGMTVFPGGGVDIRDADETMPWTGPDAEWWAGRFRIEATAARGVVVAAVRELYEETGVLLAGSPRPDAADVMVDSAYDDDRAAVAAHQRSLSAVLRARDARLRADLLRPWARRITPPGASRRYDTFFFVAALPAGQRADSVTTEATEGGWHRPADVLRAGARGEVGLMPPTVAMLTDLAAAGRVAELLAARRVLDPVMHPAEPGAGSAAG
jgi:8-oxo-dGTP pyrophosphatase MutT (NUDIX family)